MDSQRLLENFFELFRIRTAIGGLEISDLALRFAYFDGREWQRASLRLPPGILENGVVKDKNQFLEALTALKNEISKEFGGFKTSKLLNVIVSLGSVHPYTRIFTLPLLSEEGLGDAVRLNIQMLSPIDIAKAYTGWQIVIRDTQYSKLEVLVAFIDRDLVDKMTENLREAGILAIAVEFGAMSLTRLVRERYSAFDMQKSYVVLNLDSNGLDFLLIRSGQMYFEYSASWEEVLKEKKEISLIDFKEVIIRNLHRVLNFYASNWPDRPMDILISAESFPEEARQAIKEEFSLNVVDLSLKDGMPTDYNWSLPLGAALRGLTPRSRDREINLSGITSQEEFLERQTIEFLEFWRILTPLALSVVLAAFLLTNLFLANLQRSAETNSFQATLADIREFEGLSAQIENFNDSVALISSTEKIIRSKNAILSEIDKLLSAQGITLDSLSFTGYDSPVTFSGEAKSQNDILNFKQALSNDSKFKSVNLNLAGIQTTVNGYSFTLTFLVLP